MIFGYWVLNRGGGLNMETLAMTQFEDRSQQTDKTAAWERLFWAVGFIISVVCGLFLVALVSWVIEGSVVFGGTVSEDVVTPYVEVRTHQTVGSGTCIGVDGDLLVLTAAHVVEDLMGPKQETVIGEDGRPVTETVNTPRIASLYLEGETEERSIPATVVLYSPPRDAEYPGHDLCLLRPSCTDRLVAAHLGLDLKLEVGEDAWYCSTPAGLHRMLEKSIVNRLDMKLGDYSDRFLAVNGLGWHGSSGCGVFVRREVAGVPLFDLVGVCVYGNSETPKSPIFCNDQKTVKDFLASYRRHKTPPMPKADSPASMCDGGPCCPNPPRP